MGGEGYWRLLCAISNLLWIYNYLKRKGLVFFKKCIFQSHPLSSITSVAGPAWAPLTSRPQAPSNSLWAGSSKWPLEKWIWSDTLLHKALRYLPTALFMGSAMTKPAFSVPQPHHVPTCHQLNKLSVDSTPKTLAKLSPPPLKDQSPFPSWIALPASYLHLPVIQASA